MNFEFSPEQELLRATVRRFATDRVSIADHVRPLLDDPVGCDADTWKALADLGVLGLLDPTNGDRDMVTTGVVVEELGRALLPEPYLPSAVGAMAALEAGDDPALIADVASGRQIATVAIHEPGQRYSWTSPTTTARARRRLATDRSEVGRARCLRGSRVHRQRAPRRRRRALRR